MHGSDSLGRRERTRLKELYRGGGEASVRLRAHIVLLLADGQTWSMIAALLYCSTRTISRWKRRFEEGGVEALLEEHRGRRAVFVAEVVSAVITWITDFLPSHFGFVRSRWTCELMAVLLAQEVKLSVSRETIRRWLHREGIVWRRPRPVTGPVDPERKKIWHELRELLGNLPDHEIAVFQDEVDINTNPKIGCMWMRQGQQAEVVTPGVNEKRYLAGSLNWRTGELITTVGEEKEGRSSRLFIRHLEDLRTRLRRYTRIHVICDNASFHKSKEVKAYLKEHGDRIVIHFLPKWSPDLNPIERIWWQLHEAVTRNHQCFSMTELIDRVIEWMEARRPFPVERGAYIQKMAA